VHRARLGQAPSELVGADPVVTPHPKYYEEKLDPDLLELVDPTIRVVHTKAIPIGSPRIIGDIGCARYIGSLRRSTNLYLGKEIDFLHITSFQLCRFAGSTSVSQASISVCIDYQDRGCMSGRGRQTFQQGLALVSVRHLA